MQLPSDWKSKPKSEMETWFLAAAEANPLPLDAMLDVLSNLASTGDTGRCESWAELLRDALVERGDREGLLRLLEQRCTWQPEDAELRRRCARDAAAVFKDRLGVGLVKSAAFDGEIPLADSLRRLRTLLALKPGALCHERTWGFGVVKQVDDFYLKVTVDFAKKPGHQMSLTYAGETLEVIGDAHLLARKYRDAAQLAELVGRDPGEIVRIAVQSYGPLSAVRLKDVLVPEILPEAGWKAFWEAARKQLKADPLVDLPAARSEPIRLLDRKKEYDVEWFAALAVEKDPKRVLELAEEIRKECDLASLPGELRRALGERFAFAMWGASGTHPDLVVRLILAARAAGFSTLLENGGEAGVPAAANGPGQNQGRKLPATVNEVVESLLSENALLSALPPLPAREMERFLKLLTESHAERSVALLLSLLGRLPANVIGPVVEFMTLMGKEAECAGCFGAALRQRTAGGEMLFWLATNLDLVDVWEGIDVYALVLQIVNSLDGIRIHERRKSHKQLCELFADKPWLSRVMESVSADQREVLLAKVHAARSWPEVDKRTALGAMIRLHPDLGAVLTSLEEGGQRLPPRKLLFTSWRTYRERQEQLRELVEKAIPENSREIGHARGYGDLRENFEYHAARDMQLLLMRRKHELERDLVAVKVSDFSGLPPDVADMGTCVAVARPDGRQERYCILGEWDRDEKLNIIASRSKLAQALAGHKAGDEVLLPGEAGEEKARIVEVSGLTEEVKAWAAGN